MYKPYYVITLQCLIARISKLRQFINQARDSFGSQQHIKTLINFTNCGRSRESDRDAEYVVVYVFSG